MAENLWALREQKKLSVASLANRAGLPIGLIVEYESGQRSIDPKHLSRLARALYVDESEIKLESDPRPGAATAQRRPGPEQAAQEPRPSARGEPVEVVSAPGESSGQRETTPYARERPPKVRPQPRPPAPARPSQIAHLQDVLRRLNRSQEEIEAEIGKPVAELDRLAMSALLKSLQEQSRGVSVERHRPYLPESVDEHEARYLTAAQEAGDILHFTLFDGQSVHGQVIGFGPYNISVRLTDGTEITLNKLALVSYAKGQAQEPIA